MGIDFDNQVALPKLACSYEPISKKCTLYSFGGTSTEGMCFKCELHSPNSQWKALPKSYQVLFRKAFEDNKFIYKSFIQLP